MCITTKFVILTSSFPDKKNRNKGYFIYNRALQMINSGMNVEVWLIHSVLKGGRLNDYEISLLKNEKKIKVHIFNSIKIPMTYIWFGSKKLLFRLKKENVNALLVHFAWDSWLPFVIKKRNNIPYILTCHGSDIHTFPDKSKLNDILTNIFLKNANGLIFVSQYLKKIAEKRGYLIRTSKIIHNGIDRNIYKYKRSKASNSFRILFVGNLYNIKGADRLPDILHDFLKKESNAILFIAGTGPLGNSIKKSFIDKKIQNKVNLLGQLAPAKIPSLMNNSDLLIVPSRKEGFSSVIMEARSCGLPIVATNTGGIPEALGEDGFLVNEGDSYIQKFVNKMLESMRMDWDRKKISESISQLDWRNTVNQETDYFKQILKI